MAECLADLGWGDDPATAPRLLTVPADPERVRIADGVLAKMTRALDLVARWGVKVRYVDGWQTRGRDYAVFDPKGAVNHHTGGPAFSTPPQWENMIGLIVRGRSDLPGPLSQVCTLPDGVLVVVAAGLCNHAGAGGWDGLVGNQTVFGNEQVHSGGPAEPWPAAQLRTSLRWDAALATVFGWGSEMVCDHKEWGAVQGKPDRVLIDPEKYRSDLAGLLASPPEEEWMSALSDHEQREMYEWVHDLQHAMSLDKLGELPRPRYDNAIDAIWKKLQAMEATLGGIRSYLRSAKRLVRVSGSSAGDPPSIGDVVREDAVEVSG